MKNSHSKSHIDPKVKASLIREMHYRMMHNKPYHLIYESRGIPERDAKRWLQEYEEFLQTGSIQNERTSIKRCLPFLNQQPKYISLLWGRLKIKVGRC